MSDDDPLAFDDSSGQNDEGRRYNNQPYQDSENLLTVLTVADH